MVPLKRILVPVDFSELSIGALAYAESVAGWYQSEVTALHAAPTFDAVEVQSDGLFEPVQVVYTMTPEQIGTRLRSAMDVAGVPHHGVAVAAEAGTASEVILDQAKKRNADLVVMSTHGRGGWDRVILGSVTEKVLRSAPCPVLIVPPHAPQSPARIVDSVLCAVDFSPASLHAVDFAVDFAHRARAPVTFLHVVEWLAEEEPPEVPPTDIQEFRGYLVHEAEERLKELVAKQRHIERGAHAKVVPGRAYQEILATASGIAADLIVIGAQGRGGPPFRLLGSTTEQVVRTASCPVLMVRDHS